MTKTQDTLLARAILKRLVREKKAHPNGYPEGKKVAILLDAIEQEIKRFRAEAQGSGKAVAIYDAYPRKIGRQAALKAIEKALKVKPYEELLERTQAYAAAVRSWSTDFRYSGSSGKDTCPYPASWFNAGRYDDDPAEWKGDQKYHASSPVPVNKPVMEAPSDWKEKFIKWSGGGDWVIEDQRIRNLVTGKAYGWNGIPEDVRKELLYGKAS